MKNSRVLIADDSRTYRMLVKKALETIRRVELIGEVSNGQEALKKVNELKPDLLILDINMPIKDGLEVLKEIQENKIDIGVIVLSSVSRQNASITIQALNLGAFDFITKPSHDNINENFQFISRQLSQKIFLYKSIRLTQRNQRETRSIPIKQMQKTSPQRAIPAPAAKTQKQPGKHYDLMMIGISTGGPKTLNKLFDGLTKKLNIPIIIVQHMPPMFTRSLADSLNRKSLMNVKEAEDGEEIKKGSVYIAPGGKHLEIIEQNKQIFAKITDDEPVNSCKPAVDVLFYSAKEIVKRKKTLLMILTGMGKDGMDGIRSIKGKQTTVIAQDRASSVIYGMPKAVTDAGLTDVEMSLTEIINFLNSLW